MRIIQSIPSPKAEPFKLWLAQVGSERLDEIVNPELVINRAKETYIRKGYEDTWIAQRLKLRMNNIITQNSTEKLIKNIETEKENLKSKINKLIDLSIENAIDRETFLERKEKIQNKINQLNTEQEKLILEEENKQSKELSLNKLKKYLENGKIITEFDKDAFEILVKQVIVGGYDEKNNSDPKSITFVLRNESNINYKDYLQVSNEENKNNLQINSDTCGMCCSA